MASSKWYGSKTCDFCQKPISGTLIDGRTIHGPWATMCKPCAKIHGIGLGTGKGQMYDEANGEFVKVEG